MSRRARNSGQYTTEPKGDEVTTPPHQNTSGKGNGGLPTHTKPSNPEGQTERTGFHPVHFLWVCFRSSSTLSMVVNILWPVVPAAIAVHFALPEHHLLIFILNYIAMVPAANTIGFAGQELARKMPKVIGVVMEVTLGSVVEIVLFMALLVIGANRAETGYENKFLGVIKAAILGSILANLLLCMGLCFIAGGLHRHEQVFHEAVSEVGSGLMFVAAVALIIPCVFATVLNGQNVNEAGVLINHRLEHDVLNISRGTAVLLWLTFFTYLFFNLHSHHGVFDTLLEQDELADQDRHKDIAKRKLTLIESLVALGIALACVSMIAVFLVLEIEYIVEDRGISDSFMGLILVPLVEKAAEHLTAVDEAYDNQPNFALSHVLGATIQTALFNAPLVVIVGWGLGQPMDLNFLQFQAIVLILAVLAVGNFLRDGKSNYLEGALCVCIYILVALAAYYYPNPGESV